MGMTPKQPKQKKCKAKGCGVVFSPARPFQCWCSPECGLSIARAKKEQADAKKAREQRRQDKAKREKLKTRSDWMKEAQRSFNRFIRLRDSGDVCISCGVNLGGHAIGGAFDCGHFRSVGSAPHLRFNENNAHGQCKRCNRYGSGMHSDYRVGLLFRIGLDALQELEADQTLRKYTIEDLKNIRDTYRAKANELSKSIEKTN